MLDFCKTLSTKEKIGFIVKAIIAIVALVALLKLPYVYYQVLRRAVFAGSLYTIYQGIVQKQFVWIGIAIVSAVIFNPFMTPHLTREIWSLLNALVAVEFAVSAYKLK